MRIFEIMLTKSYIVRIKANSREKAKRYSELFTGDIQDISSVGDRKKYKFKIEDIDCKVNEAFEAQESEE